MISWSLYGFWYNNSKVDILRVSGSNNGTKSCGCYSFGIASYAPHLAWFGGASLCYKNTFWYDNASIQILMNGAL